MSTAEIGLDDWICPAKATRAMTVGRGRGVRIAVLDSGIEISHPAFLGRSLRDDLVIQMDQENHYLPGQGVDLYGHGTAVAGIIWDIAPEAEIGSFRILGPNLKARTAQVALAARRAMELGYDIINCSFSCSIPGHLAIYKDWVDQAALQGVHIVAASGCHASNSPEWPAHFSSVLGVDVSQSADPCLVHHRGGMIEFAAPGSDCRVPWEGNRYRIMTGSSFAAPHLTGLLGRLLSIHRLKDPLFVKALLRKTAKPA